MQLTLTQFEQIDGLFRSCLARPAIDDVINHPLASADYIRTVFYQPEWRLLDACIDAVGYDAANAFASTVECAASILTDCLTGKVEVLDEEAA